MKLSIKKYIRDPFLIISALLVLSMCVFQNWLFWPGYIQDDSQTTLLLDKSNWHPVIMACMVEIMHKMLGIHVYNLFLLTTIPFYIGIFLIIYCAYKKTNSWFCIFLMFPIFTYNLFISLIPMGSPSFTISWGCLLYAMTFYMILPEGKETRGKIFYILYSIVFAIALLSRHNAILHVWPVTLVWIGIYLSTMKDLSFWGYVGRFIPLSIFSGFFCLILLIGLNSVLAKSDNGHVYPETLVVMHQIVATCAPEMDESCFNEDWWYGKWSTDPDRMKHLKEKYNKHKRDAETFALSYDQDVTFKYFTNLEGRYSKWFYAIKKYPKNYIEHVNNYYKEYWRMKPILNRKVFRREYPREKMIRQVSIFHPISKREHEYFWSIADQIPDNERSVQWNDTKEKIYFIIMEDFLSYSFSAYVKICFALFFGGLILFLINRKNLLNLLLFSISTAGVLNWVIIPLCSPRLFVRYIEPGLACTILALDIFFIVLLLYILYICAYMKNKINLFREKRKNRKHND